MMKNENFCAFILSHGRADNCKTYHTLRKQGYTGKIYIIVDDEDKEIPRYKKNFGDEVIVFSKDEARAYCDPMDNFNDRRTPLYARNYIWIIARKLGIEYFVELDDDYSVFVYKYTRNREYATARIHELDKVFDILVDFLKSTPTTVIAMAQGGDFLGGCHGRCGMKIFLQRKTMNSFFCKVSDPFDFFGIFNDDVNSYLRNGNLGKLHFTNNILCVAQGATQQNKGGITEMYLDYGTYIKSFYSVMLMPSCVKISVMGLYDYRIHHRIKWKYAVPKIVDEKYKKK